MVRIKCIEKIEFGNPHPKKMTGFFLALEKVRGRNHSALTFGRHAAICTRTVGHIADLCRNTVMLYRKKTLIMCLSEISLLRQKFKGILCDMSRMRISAFHLHL